MKIANAKGRGPVRGPGLFCDATPLQGWLKCLWDQLDAGLGLQGLKSHAGSQLHHLQALGRHVHDGQVGDLSLIHI